MKKSTKKGVITSLIIAAGTGAAALAGFLQDRIPDDVDEPKKNDDEETPADNAEAKDEEAGDSSSEDDEQKEE